MGDKNRFIGDDDEARAWDVIKATPPDDDSLEEDEDVEEPDDEDEPDDAEEAEDKFDAWSRRMDERDARLDAADRRGRALAAIASCGVDITKSPDDGLTPLLERSDAYIFEFARTRVDGFRIDGFNPGQARDAHGMWAGGGGAALAEHAKAADKRARSAARSAGEAAETAHEARSMGDHEHASELAGDASKFAERASESAGTKVGHAAAQRAHASAAHAHQEAAKANSGTEKFAEHQQKAALHQQKANEHEAIAIGKPQNTTGFDEETTAKQLKIREKSAAQATASANKASEKAKSTGKASDHEKAANEHVMAKVANEGVNEFRQAAGMSKSATHDAAASQHQQKAQDHETVAKTPASDKSANVAEMKGEGPKTLAQKMFENGVSFEDIKAVGQGKPASFEGVQKMAGKVTEGEAHRLLSGSMGHEQAVETAKTMSKNGKNPDEIISHLKDAGLSSDDAVTAVNIAHHQHESAENGPTPPSDAGDKARALSAKANKFSKGMESGSYDNTTSSNHDLASAKHIRAAYAHDDAGNKEVANLHRKVSNLHDQLNDHYSGFKKTNVGAAKADIKSSIAKIRELNSKG